MGPLPNETNCECWPDNVTKYVGNLCLVLFNGQDISISTLGESQNCRHVRTQNGFNLLFTVIICNYFFSEISIMLILGKGSHPRVFIFTQKAAEILVILVLYNGRRDYSMYSFCLPTLHSFK